MSDAKRERRQAVKLVCEVLRSDLYERGASHPEEDPETSATWWSPLKLSVTYGYGADEQLWIRCRDSSDNLYAHTVGPNTPEGYADWLDREML